MSFSSKTIGTYPPPLAKKLDDFYIERLQNEWQGQHIMRGKIADKNDIQLVSNDYLSLANHPDILLAQKSSLEKKEQYSLMSAIFLHGDNPQMEFEKRLAEFINSDEVILCQSGYAANVGLIQAILEGTPQPVYIDRMAHMSLWDGIKMASANPIPFRHNDTRHLKSLIEKYGPGLVLVDSVYSTDGTICPLPEMVNMAFDAGCMCLVDESHSLGTHGAGGKGLVAHYNLENKVIFRTASLAKTFAGRAGLVACPDGFSDFFKFTSKPSIFSSALLPFEISGLNKTLDLIIQADIQRARLRRNTAFLREHLEAIGYNLNSGEAQIIALESGTEWNTILLRDALEKRGIFGSVFCAPATPKNRAIIRLSINSSLNKRQLLHIVEACREAAEELNVAQWKSSIRMKKRPTQPFKVNNIKHSHIEKALS